MSGAVRRQQPAQQATRARRDDTSEGLYMIRAFFLRPLVGDFLRVLPRPIADLYHDSRDIDSRFLIHTTIHLQMGRQIRALALAV